MSILSRRSKRTRFRKDLLNKISRKRNLNRSSVGGGDAGGTSAPPKVLICLKSGLYPIKFWQNP